MHKITGLIRLARPANIVTAISDILAGVAMTSFIIHDFEVNNLLLLILATVGLYGGGVVFNDVFDANLDRIERPERPIPSAVVSIREASAWGVFLLSIGITSALLVSIYPSGIIAVAIAIAALLYDKWGKHHRLLGPLNMGLCRGLNLLLGISIIPQALGDFYFLFLLPIVYIAAITMISRGEVHGGKSLTMVMAFILYTIVLACILTVAYVQHNFAYTLIYILAFAMMTFPPLFKALKHPIGKNIGRAVKAGVLALILMNAAWAAAFGSFTIALIILALLPVSILIARLFAIT